MTDNWEEEIKQRHREADAVIAKVVFFTMAIIGVVLFIVWGLK